MNANTTPITKTNGRVAIVTGGTANLGKLFAESLAGDGGNVVVHYNSPSHFTFAVRDRLVSRMPIRQ